LGCTRGFGRRAAVLRDSAAFGALLSQPWKVFAVWEGGMAFYGAIFAVVLVILIAGWRMKISILKFLDVGALFAVVGQFFGRIGNIINGDVIGYPTKLPWGFVYTNPIPLRRAILSLISRRLSMKR